ncbi:hypothetical protein AMS68_007086 [Peltaster fructicola]|uniref:Matrin-type domain-containing protein n=1 Tax=Peltaster fructicola TaxID=286661 RepID=A0A6H0Y3Z6_9PEZI|nr:hypothetical protein AMS68_007086 [Peltaster fructicola]
MLYEDLRFIHEDVERAEAAMAERFLEDPKKNRNRLARDHEIAYFANRIQEQSNRALHIYNDQKDALMQEIQAISTGNPMDEFYKEYTNIKEFHRKYPNEKVENLEVAYNRPQRAYSPERKHSYLDIFNHFTQPHCTISKREKLTDEYFSYVGSLAQYLQDFMRKTKPLEELEKVFAQFDAEFEKEWEAGTVAGWERSNQSTENGLTTQGTGEGVWCADCAKEFKSDNLYKSHLTGKKHIRNAAAKAQQADGVTTGVAAMSINVNRLKEKAVAEREFRISKLASAMQTVRAATRDNVERKAGLTERERQEELEALYHEEEQGTNAAREEEQPLEEGEDRVYNPLKLPLAWDGKPIPFWLYKLHGLGTEYRCEICGNHVYQGRRNYEKHFSETRHIRGLHSIGITHDTHLFREITSIDDAEMLWNKIRGVKTEQFREDDVVEMEDNAGSVLPLKVYKDLASEGTYQCWRRTKIEHRYAVGPNSRKRLAPFAPFRANGTLPQWRKKPTPYWHLVCGYALIGFICLLMSIGATRSVSRYSFIPQADVPVKTPTDYSATQGTCNNTIRREWRALSIAEQQAYISAVSCLRLQPSILQPAKLQAAYDDFPFVHSHVGYYTHGSAPFLPWHRYFLHIYEKTLRERCHYMGNLVYWNWTTDYQALEQSPVFDSEHGFGGDGVPGGNLTVGRTGRCVQDGPFANLNVSFYDVQVKPHCLSRGFRDQAGNLGHIDGNDLSPESIQEVMRLDRYEDFLEAIEAKVHDAIPFGIGGDFETFTAPYDPIFFLHHTMLDKLWFDWQQKDDQARRDQYGGHKQRHSIEMASLEDEVGLLGLAPAVKVADLMDTHNELLCYGY